MRIVSEAFNMVDSDEEVFYECLTSPQTPSPTTTKPFHLPLSTLSIYCRQHNSTNSSNKATNKATIFNQNGAQNKPSGSATKENCQAQKTASYISSVVEYSSRSQMTLTNSELLPNTPPLTQLSSFAQISSLPVGHEDSGDVVDSSLPSEPPPLSPSSSVTTTATISEPPTPDEDRIRPKRFWNSRTSTPSPQASTTNKLDTSTSSEPNLRHRNAKLQQTLAAPTQKPKSGRAKKSLASKSSSTTVIRKRKVPKFLPENSPFIPEGFKIINWPKAHPVVETETFESGHIIGYGTYPVQLTAQQLARQKRNVRLRKELYYRQDDEMKVIKSSEPVSGENDVSIEKEKKFEPGSN